jgi:hypothetical protein
MVIDLVRVQAHRRDLLDSPSVVVGVNGVGEEEFSVGSSGVDGSRGAGST